MRGKLLYWSEDDYDEQKEVPFGLIRTLIVCWNPILLSFSFYNTQLFTWALNTLVSCSFPSFYTMVLHYSSFISWKKNLPLNFVQSVPHHHTEFIQRSDILRYCVAERALNAIVAQLWCYLFRRLLLLQQQKSVKGSSFAFYVEQGLDLWITDGTKNDQLLSSFCEIDFAVLYQFNQPGSFIFHYLLCSNQKLKLCEIF